MKNGEGSVDGGNTVRCKVTYEDMLATTLTETAKQGCESQARPAAVRCMMARRRIERGSKHHGVREATEQRRLPDVSESDTKTLCADRIVHPTRSRRTRTTWQVGNGLSAVSAGEPRSRPRHDTKKGIGDIQV